MTDASTRSRSFRRTARCLIAAALLGLVALPIPGVAAGSGPLCGSPGEIEVPGSGTGATLRPQEGCSLTGVEIRRDGLGVVIQPPGTGVAASAASFDGNERQLVVTTQPDGTVHVIESAHEASRASLAPTDQAVSQGKDPCTNCRTACNDGAFSFKESGWKLDSSEPFEWFFNSGSTPISSKLNAAEAEDAFKGAMARVMNSKNNCWMSDAVDLDITYEGDTSADASVTESAGCTGLDGLSVVDFGALNVSPALTCTYFTIASGNPDLVIESDTRLRKNLGGVQGWTSDPKGSSCFIDYDVEGIATHEFGHTVGLSHVSAKSGNLTMSLFGLPNCSKAYRTFGRGDVMGLRALY